MRERYHGPMSERPRQQLPRAFPSFIETVIHLFSRPLTAAWDRGFRFLFIFDFFALYLSLVAINLIRFGQHWPTYSLGHHLVGFSLVSIFLLLINYFAGLYERESRLGNPPWLPRVSLALAVGVATIAVITLFTDRYFMPRVNLVLLLLLGSLALTSSRYLTRILTWRRQGPARVGIVGPQEGIQTACSQFETNEKFGQVVATTLDTSNIIDVVRSHFITDLLFLDIQTFDTAYPEPLGELEELGIVLHQRVSAQETLLGLRSIHQIAGMPFTRLRSHNLANHQRRLKRLFDLLLLLTVSPIVIPIVIFFFIYVRIVAGSAILYQQQRVGEKGETFTVFKFRTMKLDAEADGPQIATLGDPRIISSMSWMRSMRADEIPQLWNVIKGEMSLVGPRPERPEMAKGFQQEVPGYQRRTQLPPGLTGLAQVHGRYDSAAEHKLGYDLQYLVNWSLILDIQILLRTIWVVLSRRV